MQCEHSSPSLRSKMTLDPAMALPKLGPVIAIDGPAGTGKSSATKMIAKKLGYVHVDTGALYRAVALAGIRAKVFSVPIQGAFSEAQCERLTQTAKSANIQFKVDASLEPSNRVILDGQDVSAEIRTPEVSMSASAVSAVPGVRAALLGMQRRLGCQGKSVLEGRDIGTVVFPDADVKFFLTASVEERAKRRHLELQQKSPDGQAGISLDQVQKEIAQRDHDDSSRAVAPLRKADDAIELDTSQLSLEEVVDLLIQQIEARQK